MIFLSFAGENAELARTLGLRMRAAGAEVWCSVFKDELDDGHPWPDQVYTALDRCSVFVLLVTDAPIDGMTKEESDYARDCYNKHKRPRVVSVRLGEGIELPRRYESLQAVVLPADWQSDSSDFVARKLRQWGEIAATAPASQSPHAPSPPPGIAPAPRNLRTTPEPTSAPAGIRDLSAPLPDFVGHAVPTGKALAQPPASADMLSSTSHPSVQRTASAGTTVGPVAVQLKLLMALAALGVLGWTLRESFGGGTAPPGDANEPKSASEQPVDASTTPRSDRDLPPAESSVFAMVRVPAGKLIMGSAESPFYDERPPHEVTVAPFELARTEVTRRQWREVMGADLPAAGWSTDRSDDELPANDVTWDEALSFCDALSKHEGPDTGQHYRLPSEAEWEYACRAGTTTEYWSGNLREDLDRVGWFEDNSDGRPHAVGEKPANPWGLFDMHGNVWEWCEDTWHDSYEGAPSDGRAWVDEASSRRVIRGGSFVDSAVRARSADRDRSHRSDRWPGVGFRPARSVTPD